MARPTRNEPGPGQESVWDYPRPPDLRPTRDHVRIVHHGVTIAESCQAVRVCETSQPPAFYLPRADVQMEHLYRTKGRSFCEWKGAATYWAVQVGAVTVPEAAWSYEQPNARFAAITGHLAFYAQRLDECWVGDERVEPNEGDFYGGWVTSKVVGPFKGGAGSHWW